MTDLYIFVTVKPTVMEMPQVKMLNDLFITPHRQFPVGTAIQLTCEGEIGSDPNTVRISTSIY